MFTVSPSSTGVAQQGWWSNWLFWYPRATNGWGDRPSIAIFLKRMPGEGAVCRSIQACTRFLVWFLWWAQRIDWPYKKLNETYCSIHRKESHPVFLWNWQANQLGELCNKWGCRVPIGCRMRRGYSIFFDCCSAKWMRLLNQHLSNLHNNKKRPVLFGGWNQEEDWNAQHWCCAGRRLKNWPTESEKFWINKTTHYEAKKE